MSDGTILIGKTFSTIPATDDPTVAETFAKDGSPHDTVVPMRIDPDRGESNSDRTALPGIDGWQSFCLRASEKCR